MGKVKRRLPIGRRRHTASALSQSLSIKRKRDLPNNTDWLKTNSYLTDKMETDEEKGAKGVGGEAREAVEATRDRGMGQG